MLAMVCAVLGFMHTVPSSSPKPCATCATRQHPRTQAQEGVTLHALYHKAPACFLQ